jgi:hypothetical protein
VQSQRDHKDAVQVQLRDHFFERQAEEGQLDSERDPPKKFEESLDGPAEQFYVQI